MKMKKNFFRIIDLVSILTIIILLSKYLRFFNEEVSKISFFAVVLFFACLERYVRKNEIERQAELLKNGRPGGAWLIIWLIIAVSMTWCSIANPGKYDLPTAELIAVLGFSFFMYLITFGAKSRTGEKLLPELDSKTIKVFNLFPSIIVVYVFRKEEED